MKTKTTKAKPKTAPKPLDDGRSHAPDCSARRVFSLPLSDRALASFVEQQGSKHKRGVSGYLRGLVVADREQWLDMAQLRELALSKLTDNERAALGYPPNA